MMNKFLMYASLCLSLALWSGPSRAQDCSIQYEMRVQLRKPDQGAPNLWDSVYGKPETEEVFKTGLVLSNGQVFVVGERAPRGMGGKEIILVQIGRNGRVLMEQSYKLAGLENIVKVFPHEKGYAVFANQSVEDSGAGKKKGQSRNVIWMGIFDSRGVFLEERRIENPKASVRVFDVLPQEDQKSFLLSATFRAETLDQPPSAILYKIDQDGKILADHAFVIGTENRIAGLDLLEDGGILATGFSYGDDRRKNGWILRLTRDFGIVWQNVYQRGMGAELSSGKSMPNNTIAVVGTAAPTGGKTGRGAATAGWAMVVHADNGTVGWQRFFSSALSLDGRDVQASKDGTMSIMLDGDEIYETKKKKTGTSEDALALKETGNIRLLTLSARGVLLASDTFFGGEGVDGFQVLSGQNGERILVGSTKVRHQIENPVSGGDMDPVISKEGWVMTATSVEPYRDPCGESYD